MDEKTRLELERIRKQVPPGLMKRLIMKRKVSPEIKKAILAGIRNEDTKEIDVPYPAFVWYKISTWKNYGKRNKTYKAVVPVVSDTQKEQWKALVASGALDMVKEVINKSAEKELDKWWTNEIQKAIKLGRLNPPSVSSPYQIKK